MFHFNNLNTMMKKINKYGSIALLTITVAVFTGCSDQFLEDKNYMEVLTVRLFMKTMSQLITV